jgi:purine-binding chemotaxis protein CheW
VDEPVHKLVIFELAGQRFAFYGDRIREILAQAVVFFVPGSPHSLEGVINVRGDIESGIRPHTLLHLPEDGIGRASSILPGRAAGMSSGIRVDRVLDVVDVTQSSVQPPLATLPVKWRRC